MPKIKNIKLYSTTMCPYCKMEKAWLEGNKIDHEVSYVDQNQKEAIEMVRATGQMGVPVTKIEFENSDTKYVIGFDVPQLSNILGLKS